MTGRVAHGRPFIYLTVIPGRRAAANPESKLSNKLGRYLRVQIDPLRIAVPQ